MSDKETKAEEELTYKGHLARLKDVMSRGEEHLARLKDMLPRLDGKIAEDLQCIISEFERTLVLLRLTNIIEQLGVLERELEANPMLGVFIEDKLNLHMENMEKIKFATDDELDLIEEILNNHDDIAADKLDLIEGLLKKRH
jgi:hypothetical protein